MSLLKAVSCFFFLVFLLGSTCATRTAPKAVRHQAVPVPLRLSKTFHVDKGITPSGFKVISSVADIVNDQANGMIHAFVVQDLDWEGSVASIVEFEESDQIVAIPHDADVVKKLDMVYPNEKVFTLGYVTPNSENPKKPKKINLVIDRITNTRVLFHVTLHEMLHAFGASHSKDPNAVMYYKTLPDDLAMCLNVSDMDELCKAWGCDPLTLNYCE